MPAGLGLELGLEPGLEPGLGELELGQEAALVYPPFLEEHGVPVWVR